MCMLAESLHVESRERESSMELSEQGMCCADTVHVAMRNGLRKKCVVWGQWEVPDVIH